jgi:hypothetical protein
VVVDFALSPSVNLFYPPKKLGWKQNAKDTRIDFKEFADKFWDKLTNTLIFKVLPS